MTQPTEYTGINAMRFFEAIVFARAEQVDCGGEKTNGPPESPLCTMHEANLARAPGGARGS